MRKYGLMAANAPTALLWLARPKWLNLHKVHDEYHVDTFALPKL